MNILLGIMVIFVMATFSAFPLAFFSMLFLGNLGLNFSFISLLPGAMAARMVTTSLISMENKKGS